ncbi:MAG: archease [Pseudomonadota bacterium]
MTASEPAYWEHFPHGADIGIRGVGRGKAEAFAQAGLALSAIVTRLEAIRARQATAISCAAANDELLFFAWINQLIFHMAADGLVFGRYDIAIDDARLDATAWGESLDRMRHRPAAEVKAATFTELMVYTVSPDRWIAQCVVDV